MEIASSHNGQVEPQSLTKYIHFFHFFRYLDWACWQIRQRDAINWRHRRWRKSRRPQPNQCQKKSHCYVPKNVRCHRRHQLNVSIRRWAATPAPVPVSPNAARSIRRSVRCRRFRRPKHRCTIRWRPNFEPNWMGMDRHCCYRHATTTQFIGQRAIWRPPNCDGAVIHSSSVLADPVQSMVFRPEVRRALDPIWHRVRNGMNCTALVVSSIRCRAVAAYVTYAFEILETFMRSIPSTRKTDISFDAQ